MKTSGIRFRFFFKHSSLPSKGMFSLIGDNVLTSGESWVRSGDIKEISWHNFLFVWDSGSASQRWDDKTTFCTSLIFGEGLSSSGNILLILGDSSRLFGKNSTFFGVWVSNEVELLSVWPALLNNLFMAENILETLFFLGGFLVCFAFAVKAFGLKMLNMSLLRGSIWAAIGNSLTVLWAVLQRCFYECWA